MKADDFEQRLQRQPLREVPAEWRSRILSKAAIAARPTNHSSDISVFTLFAMLRAEVGALLWPSPKVWAGLAAIWLLLVGVDRATLNPSEGFAKAGRRPPVSS